MYDYIKREDVMEIVKRTSGDYAAAFSEIRKLPSADVVKVTHGVWQEIRDPYGKLEGWICECGRESMRKEKYCPSCGNKMDGLGNESEIV